MRAGVCSVTGLPATAAHWFPRPRGSERQSPANAQRCRQLGGPPGSCLHARPTRTALAEETSRLGPALAASASLPCLLARSGSRPLPGGARRPRAPRGTGRSGLPSPLLLSLPHPPRGAGSPQSLDAARHRARSRLCPHRRRRPRARMGGDGRAERRGVGAGRPESGGPRSFPGAGPREHGASACVHAPLTELLAAGQPLITRGPASPLAEASHTFAVDWPTPGPAPSPAPRRGAGRAAT